MPAKKKVVLAKTKVPAKKAKAKKRAKKTAACSLPKTCKYLEEWEKYFSDEILPYYIKLQRAMCHLERVVIDGKAVDPALRRCSGSGGGVEPPDPPKPPKW